MNFRIALALILPLILFSCKKNRLKGDREILMGKWEWIYSVKYTSYANGNLFYDTILPLDVTSSYGVEFLKKGKVLLKENDSEVGDFGTVFKEFQITGSVPGCFTNNGNVYDFNIHLDNDENHTMQGCVSSDSLSFYKHNFPFADEINETVVIVHKNIFKRVN